VFIVVGNHPTFENKNLRNVYMSTTKASGYLGNQTFILIRRRRTAQRSGEYTDQNR